MVDPSVAVQMAPSTAKDLYLLLGDLVARIEKQFGKIETDFTRKREAEAADAKKRH